MEPRFPPRPYYGTTNLNRHPSSGALYSGDKLCLFQCHAYSQRSVFWLVFPLYAFQWSFFSLEFSFSTSRQGSILWLLFLYPKHLVFRNLSLLNLNGNSLYGLCFTLGANELLGGHRHNKSFVPGALSGALGLRRFFCFQSQLIKVLCISFSITFFDLCFHSHSSFLPSSDFFFQSFRV